MNTIVEYQKISPLDVALGAFYNLSQKAQKEFLKIISAQAKQRLMDDIEEGRKQIAEGDCVKLETEEQFNAYFEI